MGSQESLDVHVLRVLVAIIGILLLSLRVDVVAAAVRLNVELSTISLEVATLAPTYGVKDHLFFSAKTLVGAKKAQTKPTKNNFLNII